MSKRIEKYEDRVVIFLDILGFKELVQKSHNNDKHIAKIKTAIKLIRKAYGTLNKNQERMITQFSDSIIVSFLIKEKGEVAYLLSKTQQLLKKLITIDIVCRGGIAKGNLIHNHTSLIFGQSLIDAHEAESKIALYPRVILTKSIIDLGIENYGYHPANDADYESTEINSFLSIDFDGFYYIDYFKTESFFQLSMKDNIYLNKLCNFIANQLILNVSIPHVKQKYEWMKSKYNDQVQNVIFDNRITNEGFELGSNKKSKIYKNIKPLN
jgi:hypothetical protein